MAGKRLNKQHPDYEKFEKGIAEIAHEFDVGAKEIESRYIGDPDRIFKIAADSSALAKKCNKKAKDLRVQFTYLYEDV